MFPTDKDFIIEDEIESLLGVLDDEVYNALLKLSSVELFSLAKVLRKAFKEKYKQGYSDAHNIVHFDDEDKNE